MSAIDMLLAPEEVAKLTGIRGGTKGKTRSARQIEQLRKMKIPHYVNAADRPVVVRAMIEGGNTAGAAPAPAPGWEPGI